MKRTFIITIVATGIGISAYFANSIANRSARQTAQREHLIEALSRDAGYTETILKAEADSSNITYQELFGLCEKAVLAKTEFLIELRGPMAWINPDLREKLTEYINAETSVIRAKANYYRRKLELEEQVKRYQALSERAKTIEKMQNRALAKDDLSEGLRYAKDVLAILEQKMIVRRPITSKAVEVTDALNEYITKYQTALKVESDLKKAAAFEKIEARALFSTLVQTVEDSAEQTRLLLDDISKGKV